MDNLVKCPHCGGNELSTVEGAARGRVPGLRPVVYNRPSGATEAGADREAEAAGIAAAPAPPASNNLLAPGAGAAAGAGRASSLDRYGLPGPVSGHSQR